MFDWDTWAFNSRPESFASFSERTDGRTTAFDTGLKEMHNNIGHLKEEKKEAILIVGMSCANGSARRLSRLLDRCQHFFKQYKSIHHL
ncbi:hypothetical protein OUZ56_027516 [Daphnia magna]|uniref:Uncharacterized protein n=1 Tax=Daphnia magna TaxID=35525 RepID=A0ABQ9ZQ07_9CRUS|nr:hypothetical protein OUZ56_027516 [Daphnia magna]